MPEDRRDAELRTWLDRATDGLCDVAKQRIEAEIRGRYAETVAAKIAKGWNEDEAHGAAMAALGSETVARSVFSETYLTAREAKGLASWAKSRLWLGFVMLCFLVLPLLFLMSKHVTILPIDLFDGVALGLFVLLLLVILTMPFFCRRLARQRQWRRVLIWEVASFSLLIAVEMAFALHPVVTDAMVARIVWFSCALGQLIPLSRLVKTLRKLDKHAELYDSLGDEHNGGRYA